ncbi:MAG: hypothetical protein JW938_00480 [Candidatus Omnitrophica bacterium]|nr:hypothetical protein [Candidatus Omnitrophota bacterium]
MKKNRLLSVIVISFVFIMFASMPCAASVAELQSQLASIQSQIASINAQIAQLQSQLAQLQGEGGQEGQGGQGEAEDEGDYDGYGDDYDDTVYYDDDGNAYTDEDIDRMIDEGVFNEGGLPDWAVPLDERERYDFPDDPDEMTGGGVYTSRGVGDGQKITDWNSDPMGTDINERTRDDGDYGPTDWEDGEEPSDKDDWAGGSWVDEDPSSSGEQGFPSPGGSSAGGEDHPHNTDGSDASSGGGGMFGFLGGMLAEPLVETAATIADATTSPFQDGSTVEGDFRTPASSGTTGEDRSQGGFDNMDPEALEGLQRYGDALNLGMGADGGASTGASSASDNFDDGFTRTPMSPHDAAMFGGALLGDQSGSSASGASSSSTTETQTARAETSSSRTGTSSSGIKSRTGWSQPSRVGAGTTSTDAHILPGSQNVVPDAASSSGAGRDTSRSAAASSDGPGTKTVSIDKAQIQEARSSLIKVERALEEALHQGEITPDQYVRAMEEVERSQRYLDAVETSKDGITYEEVAAMNADIATQIANVRGVLGPARGSTASTALDKYETVVHQAIEVDTIEAINMGVAEEVAVERPIRAVNMGVAEQIDIIKDSVRQRRFVDTVEMIPENERSAVAVQERFVDSTEVLGAEGRPVEVLERREVYVKPIPEQYEKRVVEGKPMEALERHEVFVKPVPEQYEKRVVEGKPIAQYGERAIEVRPVIEEREEALVAYDTIKQPYSGEIVRETIDEQEHEQVPQQGFLSRFWGLFEEDKEEVKYVK